MGRARFKQFRCRCEDAAARRGGSDVILIVIFTVTVCTLYKERRAAGGAVVGSAPSAARLRYLQVASSYTNFNTDTNNFVTFPAAVRGSYHIADGAGGASVLRAHYANIIFEIFTGSFKLSPLGITCTAVDVTRVSTALRTETGAGGRGGARGTPRRRPPCAATDASEGRPRRGRTACKCIAS